MTGFKMPVPTRRLSALSLILICQCVFAGDYSDNITEDYLRSQFTFGAEDSLKYSHCEKKSYPTCTYVWGPESKKDEARVSAGLAPEGNKLQIVYAQARSQKDFQTVLARYSDAEAIDGIGEDAVWSGKRNQLSLITDKNLIVHVNIDEHNGQDSMEKAVVIAGDLLEKL